MSSQPQDACATWRSLSHPCAASRSLTQPRAASRSLAQPRVASRSLAQPQKRGSIGLYNTTNTARNVRHPHFSHENLSTMSTLQTFFSKTARDLRCWVVFAILTFKFSELQTITDVRFYFFYVDKEG